MVQRSRFRPAAGCAWIIGTFALGGTPALHAAGFALIEQSVAGMGTAYAGSAAIADSVDTLYFNPAGMTRLPGTRAGAAVHLILPQTEFRDSGSTFVNTLPLGGGDGGDAGGLAAVPHAYVTHQLSDSAWLGLAINAPFGLTTEYDDGWVGRYHAIKSAVKTVNINPSFAIKVSNQLSFALGASAMYLDGEFTNAVDFGLIAGGPAAAGSADGKSRIEGDSWGYGFNAGLLFELSDDTRFGVHYRSEVEQEIEGDIRFDFLGGPAIPGFTDAAAKTTIDLPAMLSVSGYHQINDQWAIMADYTWTGWSSIPELRFDFANALPDAVYTYRWEDTDRVAIGATFKPSGVHWTYRFGVAYDESPVRDAQTRTPRLPDTDRIWLNVGAGFEPRKNLKVDIGYAHLFINDPRIAKTATGEDTTRGALNGTYESSVDILSIEARYLF